MERGKLNGRENCEKRAEKGLGGGTSKKGGPERSNVRLKITGQEAPKKIVNDIFCEQNPRDPLTCRQLRVETQKHRMINRVDHKLLYVEYE